MAVVDPDLIEECWSIGRELEAARDDGGADSDQLNDWMGRLAQITGRLASAGRPCPECGEPMTYDLTLQAHACHHIEDQTPI